MKLYDIAEDSTFIYLVLEYVDGISLGKHISNAPNKQLKEEEAKYIFK